MPLVPNSGMKSVTRRETSSLPSWINSQAAADVMALVDEKKQYSVISFHEEPAYGRYRDPSELIPNATASGVIGMTNRGTMLRLP